MQKSIFLVNWFVFLLLPFGLSAEVLNDSCSIATFQKILVNEQTNLIIRQTSCVVETADSNILICGRMYNQPPHPADFRDSSFVTKLNKSGDVIWSKQIGGSTSLLQKIIELPGNQYLIAHTSYSVDTRLGWENKRNAAKYGSLCMVVFLPVFKCCTAY